MDSHSLQLLIKVHPDLVKVIEAASQEPQAFEVVYSIRTPEAEKEAVATGHSTTMHSRHLPNKDGVSCAVDVAARVAGKISWAPGDEAEVFGNIAKQIKESATALGVLIHWGGDWVSFKDWGHFELDWGVYP